MLGYIFLQLKVILTDSFVKMSLNFECYAISFYNWKLF